MTNATLNTFTLWGSSFDAVDWREADGSARGWETVACVRLSDANARSDTVRGVEREPGMGFIKGFRNGDTFERFYLDSATYGTLTDSNVRDLSRAALDALGDVKPLTHAESVAKLTTRVRLHAQNAASSVWREIMPYQSDVAATLTTDERRAIVSAMCEGFVTGSETVR